MLLQAKQIFLSLYCKSIENDNLYMVPKSRTCTDVKLVLIESLFFFASLCMLLFVLILIAKKVSKPLFFNLRNFYDLFNDICQKSKHIYGFIDSFVKYFISK
jgi:hypothetical protein